MADPLRLQWTTLGWQQMLTSRSKMLDDFDRARTQARGHKVEVYHGHVAEAAVREWLGGFLPKRYGVTSGYIISPGLKCDEKAPHYDVIVYDQLESPILWIEEHGDLAERGRVLAIPVEYVQWVLEVKSAMSSTTVHQAIEHLRELEPLMRGYDAPQSAYNVYLPPTFSCGIIFFELRSTDERSDAALAAFLEARDLRGFLGGLVLRAESHTTGNTGRVNFVLSEVELAEAIPEQTLLSEYGISKSIKIADMQHLAAQIEWMEAGFSRFGFDMLARMQDRYQPGKLSSFYGMGSSHLELIAASQRHGVPRKDIT